MGLTKDEVVLEATSNPAFKAEIISSLKDDVIESLKAEGIHIRNAEEEKRFLHNYEKNVIPEKVKEFEKKIFDVHTQYDNDISELTGIPRNINEKSPEYLKRAISTIKEARKGGNTDPVLADKLKNLEAELEKRKDYVPKEELTKLEQKYFAENINNRLTSALEKFTIAVPAHITEEKAKSEFAQSQRNMMRTDYLQTLTAKKDNEGNIVYYEGEKLLTNPQTAKPLTESEIIAKRYAGYFVPEQKSKTGTGTGKDGKKLNVDVNEASLKTKQEVLDYLAKKYNPQGINQGSQKWNDEYTRIVTEQGITE